MAGVGRRGPAPAPTERKRALGNPGKRRLPAPVVALAPVVRTASVIGRPASGADLVDRLLDSGASAWIAEPDQIATLPLVARMYDELLALESDIGANGYSYTSFSKVSGEQRKTRPEVDRLAHLEKELRTWFSLYGLTPSDRTHLGVAEVRRESTLDRLRARREARGHRAS